jgi:hypothetical protein
VTFVSSFGIYVNHLGSGWSDDILSPFMPSLFIPYNKSLHEEGEKEEGHMGAFSGSIFAGGTILPFLPFLPLSVYTRYCLSFQEKD